MICRLFFLSHTGIKRQRRVCCLASLSPFFKAFLGQKIGTSMLFSKSISLSFIKIFYKNICTLKKLLYALQRSKVLQSF